MKYMSLDQRGSVQAEYIWIDAVGGTRSKTKVCFNLSIEPLLDFRGVGLVAQASLSLDRSR